MNKIPTQYAPGVSFDGVHSFLDWGLILQEREIGTPSVKTNTVDVQSVNGVLDLTESPGGEVFYGNRTLKLTFTTWKDMSGKRWPNLLSSISNALHGKKTKIVFDDDSSFYYTGRCSINSFQTSKIRQTIEIDCDCFPYKYETLGSLENDDWIWDTFDLDNGVVRDYNNIDVIGALDLKIDGNGLPVVPIFYAEIAADSSLAVEYLGEIYELKDGENVFYTMKLSGGENTLRFVGDGVVSVDYRGGSL